MMIMRANTYFQAIKYFAFINSFAQILALSCKVTAVISPFCWGKKEKGGTSLVVQWLRICLPR